MSEVAEIGPAVVSVASIRMIADAPIGSAPRTQVSSPLIQCVLVVVPEDNIRTVVPCEETAELHAMVLWDMAKEFREYSDQRISDFRRCDYYPLHRTEKTDSAFSDFRSHLR